MIDKYIEMSMTMDNNSHGSNKKCFYFDDYVLLCGNSVDRDNHAISKINVMKELKEKGVNVVRLLEYKRVGNRDYELQERAPGSELYDYHAYNSIAGQKQYLSRLKEISMQDDSFYDKFISDWDNILTTGLDVDPSKCNNFFFSNNQIYFIDLNRMGAPYEQRNEYKYMEMAVVLRGGGLPWMCEKVTDEALSIIPIIYQKIGLSIIRMNGDIDTYIMQVDPNDRYGLRDFFVNKKVK